MHNHLSSIFLAALLIAPPLAAPQPTEAPARGLKGDQQRHRKAD